jgi:single-strand DNA-binding protein
MANGNELTITGNITSDPDLKILQSGVAIANFSLAWNRRYKDGDEWAEEPNFFDVTCWRDLAENVTESFRKGDRVTVTGRLSQERWEDRETGKGRSKVVIVADDVAASVRWATVEISRVEREEGGRGGRGGGGGRDSGRGRSGGGDRGRASSGRDDRYANEEPF